MHAFRLLDLPAELIAKVVNCLGYESRDQAGWLLPADERGVGSSCRSTRQRPQQRLFYALSLTCSRLREPAQRQLFHNPDLENGQQLEAFLQALLHGSDQSAPQSKFVRNVWLDLDFDIANDRSLADIAATIARIFSLCTNIQTLFVDVVKRPAVVCAAVQARCPFSVVGIYTLHPYEDSTDSHSYRLLFAPKNVSLPHPQMLCASGDLGWLETTSANELDAGTLSHLAEYFKGNPACIRRLRCWCVKSKIFLYWLRLTWIKYGRKRCHPAFRAARLFIVGNAQLDSSPT